MPRPASNLIVVLFGLVAAGCSVMPRELNLTPLWFHRMDAEGNLLEWDAVWPVLHYERTPEGGDDFRVRPLYRRVTEPSADLPADSAVEHQFLAPFGRIRSYPDETSARLFPLWSWRSRVNEDGERDVDWYLLFPFVWGGSAADGREDYFAVFPLWADVPQCMTYDRFRTFLFPLWVCVDKGGHRHHLFLWPLIGYGSCAEADHSWFRVIPLYGHDIEPGRFDRRFLLWPFFSWSTENEDGNNGPVRSFSFWPLFGWRSGIEASGWAALWPFFQANGQAGTFYRLTLLWPVFRYYWNRLEDDIHQWWLFPFVSRTKSTDQDAWVFLWPLIWFRDYLDPDGTNSQQWVLPFFWHVAKKWNDGRSEDHVKLWPLAHRTVHRDADGVAVRGDWSLLSPLVQRDGMASGLEEAYGFLWELARGVQRAPDDDALDVAGRLYTQRARADGTTASVPFLFNYEQDEGGARTLRLFQFLPIPLGSAARVDQ
ncbi:MAG: hypothetical protein H6835_07490 [Planctomycetes bacterium]|nr:hypothetical protein [Planctomycetota bacterium]